MLSDVGSGLTAWLEANAPPYMHRSRMQRNSQGI